MSDDTTQHNDDTTQHNGVTSLLSFADVDMRFETGTLALDRVSLSLRTGEFVSVIGPSGCGKSTLLRIASNLTPATGGTVEIRTTKIGYVFQDATLLPWRTVKSNVELFAELRGLPKGERRRRADDAIELVGLSDFADHRPRALSGGMRMRVSLARSLTLEPELFLFDEPFGALDEITRERLNDELLQLYLTQRFTALFVTHSVAEAVFMSTRVVVMSARPGRIPGRLRRALRVPPVAEASASRSATSAFWPARCLGPTAGRRMSVDTGLTGPDEAVARGPISATSRIARARGGWLATWGPPAAVFAAFSLAGVVRRQLPAAGLPAPVPRPAPARRDPGQLPRPVQPQGAAERPVAVHQGGLHRPGHRDRPWAGPGGGDEPGQVDRALDLPLRGPDLQTIPILAMVPLFGFWFGFGLGARVLVVVLFAIFPIIANTLFGLQSVDQEHHDLFTLHGASRGTRLWKLGVPPTALPSIFTGLRIAAGLAVIGAIVADFFFQRGTGHRAASSTATPAAPDRAAGDGGTPHVVVRNRGVLVFGFAAPPRHRWGRWHGTAARRASPPRQRDQTEERTIPRFRLSMLRPRDRLRGLWFVRRLGAAATAGCYPRRDPGRARAAGQLDLKKGGCPDTVVIQQDCSPRPNMVRCTTCLAGPTQSTRTRRR